MAIRARRWALFHGDAFGEMPIFDRVPLQYYGKTGLEVIKSAIEENKRDSVGDLEAGYISPDEVFMFLGHKNPIGKEKIREQVVIDDKSNKKPWYVCQVLYKHTVGWIITESLNSKTLGFKRII